MLLLLLAGGAGNLPAELLQALPSMVQIPPQRPIWNTALVTLCQILPQETPNNRKPLQQILRLRWLHSKKLPSWAMSVRPKFNKPPLPDAAEGPVQLGPERGHVAKCRILVLLGSCWRWHRTQASPNHQPQRVRFC